MRKSTRVLGAVAFAGLVAAGSAAYTDSNAQPASQVVGYGSTTVTGATVNSIQYNLNPAGDNVDSVTLVLAGDTTSSAVSIGFDGGATTSCGTGTYAGTPGATTYTCNDSGENFVQATADLTSTAVVVN